jgi:sec-independent protein translocase protein TatC
VDTQSKQQALAEHLLVLRRVLLISAVTLAVAFFLIFYFACQPLVEFILAPLHARSIEVVATRVTEALVMQLKACLVAATVAAMPVIMWQIWTFVAPGLYPKEKRLFAFLFFVALLLFGFGILFAYLYVFPLAINLFFEAGVDVARSLWSVEQYFNFTLSFVIPFGLIFEMPIAIFMMTRHGWLHYQMLAKNRKYVLLATVTIAAILTPPDVLSQIMLSIPMYALYEVSVQIARFVKPIAKEARSEG